MGKALGSNFLSVTRFLRARSARPLQKQLALQLLIPMSQLPKDSKRQHTERDNLVPHV